MGNQVDEALLRTSSMYSLKRLQLKITDNIHSIRKFRIKKSSKNW